MRVLFSVFALLVASTFMFATPTTIVVRAKAKDAKFIGSSVGGAHVIIRNKMTQEILAQGITEGSTGNTDKIMRESRERYTQLADDNTAKFTAVLDLDQPTLLEISVTAPVNQRQAAAVSSTEIWGIPGKDILGDGIVLEIPGFIIDVLSPRTHQFITLNERAANKLSITANVVMMCGCTISDGGLWDANKMEVKAMIKLDGEAAGEVELRIDQPNLFKGEFLVPASGLYEIVVYAYDPATGNTGVDKVNVVVN
ncbi:MAG: hypothetical protein AAFY48_06540 [Bacteroidota bacterium]